MSRDGLAEPIQQFAALFGALIVTWLLIGAGTVVAELLGYDPVAGGALVGFFGTLFFVFGEIVQRFDVTPPEEFREVESRG